jgi:N-methylhydantoinase A
VNARLSVIGRLPQAERGLSDTALVPAQPKTRRQVFLGSWVQVPVFDFSILASDQTIRGPAVIESDTTTVLLRPGDTARFDARGWLDVTIDPPSVAALTAQPLPP